MYKISQWLLDTEFPISPTHISSNPHPGAIQFLKSNPQYMNWAFLSSNPYAMTLLRANPDKIHRDMINLNPNALDLITPFNINWFWFSKNPALFKSNFAQTDDEMLMHVDTYELVKNKSLEAYGFILRNMEFFLCNYYDLIANNPFAFKFSSEYEPHCIPVLNWMILSENPEAIDTLLTQPDRIYWPNFCKNPSAIPYIQSNSDKITPSIWQNPGIFELDYQAMAIQRTNVILEELMAKTLHPSRIEYWLMNGLDIDDL